jgi:small-conductance mechanosensitive channel
MCRTNRFKAVLIGVLLLCGAGTAPAQSGDPGMQAPAASSSMEAAEPQLAPVVVDGVTLFRVRGVTSFPAEQRAQAIADRIVSLAADRTVSPQSLRLVDRPEITYIAAGQLRIMGVVDADARVEGIERALLAKTYATRIGDAIDAFRRDRRPEVLGRQALYAAGGAIVLGLVLWLAHWIVRRLRSALQRRYQAIVRDVHIQSFQIVRAEQLWRLLSGALSLCWAVALLAGVYVYLQNVLPRFPWTRSTGHRLSEIVMDPIRTMATGVIAQIPNLAFLVILVLVTRYLLKLIRLFFGSVAAGNVTLANFEPDWAWPTYRLLRLLVVAFALVVAYPYIPGSGSDAFKGVSLFIGVIFSLGSSSLISNAIAGYSMTYRRAFRVGDRVKIGEHVGDVERMRLMVTHLRSPKNEEIVVPNSVILSTEVVNYSTMARDRGLILHTTVGIGYETPWRQVEAMLLEAAARTPGLSREPPPFVLQKGLGDFCVTYEINAYCSDPQTMARLYTALHQNILDIFNEYDVQIMTPAYEGDPQQPKVVPKSMWYAAPARPPEASRDVADTAASQART